MKLLAFGLFLSAIVPGCRASDGPDAPAATIRIGTYHAPSLVIAWVRSAEHAKQLDALVAARNSAAKMGDKDRVAMYESKGAAMQDLAHRQLAGEAGIEDILARLEKDLPEIRREARVEEIFAEGVVLGDRVEFVDITDQLVERFHPDEATRKLLSEARKHPGGMRVH